MVKRAAISKESEDWQKLYQKLLKMEKMLSTEDSSIRCLSNKDCLKYAQVNLGKIKGVCRKKVTCHPIGVMEDI